MPWALWSEVMPEVIFRIPDHIWLWSFDHLESPRCRAQTRWAASSKVHLSCLCSLKKTPSETHSVKIHYWKSIICFSLASLVGTDRCVSDIASATSSNKNRTSWHFPDISRTKKKTWPHTTNVESIKDNFSPSHWTRWNAKGATIC